MIMKILPGLIFAALMACSCNDRAAADKQADASYQVLDSVKVGDRLIALYLNLGADSAVLGFTFPDEHGASLYFPMYCSTYRGLPAVTLGVYVSTDKNSMWVRSSWKGYEVIGYYGIIGGAPVTHFGDKTVFRKPTPDSVSVGKSNIPEMDPAKATKVLTITYPERKQIK